MGADRQIDIVVIGGGVIGLSAAWRAAADGRSVAVVDPRPGHGATWAAAGMLAPVGESHFGEEPLTQLNLLAARAWPDFARRLEGISGQQLGYLACGAVLAGMDVSDRRHIDDVLGFQLDLGLDARRLSSGECRSLEPLLAPAVRGGAEFHHDHLVDNRRVVRALVVACERSGVDVILDEVAAVSVAGDRAVGVRLQGGDAIDAGAVVLAAGCRSGQISGVPRSSLPPVRPVKGLTLRLRAPSGGPRLSRTIRGLVHGRTCYLAPRQDGTLVVGATVEERGFDLTVQAGGVHDLLADSRSLVPAIDEYELFEMATGSRPGTPDNAPIVGWAPLRGLLVATGHYRNGILQAPLTAEAVAALLRGEPIPDAWRSFGLERFDAPPTQNASSTEPRYARELLS